MAVRMTTATLRGVEATPVEVEVDLLRRLPGVCVVGLAAVAVREAAERVRSAIVAAGAEFPRKRVVINLAPAGERKEGAAFDLPMALGILAADGSVPEGSLAGLLAVGELSLGGRLRPVRGGIALATLARALDRTIILPTASARQAALVPGARVLAADHLSDVIAHLRGERALSVPPAPEVAPAPSDVDLAEVRGQALARRALELAAAGAHHVMMLGPPGCGKSMLARRLPTILPELSFEEALEVTRVHDAAGLLRDDAGLVGARPFRAPHHSVTAAGLVGDRTLRPGELGLAHHGVLFLDEAPEFARHVLEVLRAPLEDREVRLVRAEGAVHYPAAVTLVMAANPCPCGMRGSPLPCRCSDGDVQRYVRRLSGPLLDRIDLHVDLQPVPADTLLASAPGEDSATVRERVQVARSRQQARGQAAPNGQLDQGELVRRAPMSDAARATLHDAVRTLSMSGRGAARVLRVARTIADLADAETVDRVHVVEALGFRPAVEGVA